MKIKENSIVTLNDGRKGKVIGQLENGKYILASGQGGQVTYFKENIGDCWKVVKINQLDSSIEEFAVDKLDKKTFDFVLGIFGFEFNKVTEYWEAENEMVGLEEEE